MGAVPQAIVNRESPRMASACWSARRRTSAPSPCHRRALQHRFSRPNCIRRSAALNRIWIVKTPAFAHYWLELRITSK